jgi:cytochrome c oxidase subunit 2
MPAASLAAAMPPLRAQAAAPLQYFLHAAGPASVPTMRLAWALTALVCAVVLVVGGLLAAALVRRRESAAPSSAHDANRLAADTGGMAWIYIGTGISSAALFASLIYVMVTLDSVAAPPRPPALTIGVTAYDWWWKVDYRDSADPARNFTTANEIHIPVGEPVAIELTSADVVHAFWVPQLAGKTETIPGQTNEQWIEADRPGIYRGQCSQFCGAQHAHMAFEVVAQPPADFDAWRVAEARAAQPVSGKAALDGQQLFGERCAGCHTVRGTKADGLQAPDLTHVASRLTIAAGETANTPANLLDWVEHAQHIKPESLMPSMPLSASEASALSVYLATLR